MKPFAQNIVICALCLCLESAFDLFYSELQWPQTGYVAQIEQNAAALLSLKAVHFAIAFLSTRSLLYRLARSFAPVRRRLGILTFCLVLACAEATSLKARAPQNNFEQPQKNCKKTREADTIAIKQKHFKPTGTPQTVNPTLCPFPVSQSFH